MSSDLPISKSRSISIDQQRSLSALQKIVQMAAIPPSRFLSRYLHITIPALLLRRSRRQMRCQQRANFPATQKPKTAKTIPFWAGNMSCPIDSQYDIQAETTHVSLLSLRTDSCTKMLVLLTKHNRASLVLHQFPVLEPFLCSLPSFVWWLYTRPRAHHLLILMSMMAR